MACYALQCIRLYLWDFTFLKQDHKLKLCGKCLLVCRIGSKNSNWSVVRLYELWSTVPPIFCWFCMKINKCDLLWFTLLILDIVTSQNELLGSVVKVLEFAGRTQIYCNVSECDSLLVNMLNYGLHAELWLQKYTGLTYSLIKVFYDFCVTMPSRRFCNEISTWLDTLLMKELSDKGRMASCRDMLRLWEWIT